MLLCRNEGFGSLMIPGYVFKYGCGEGDNFSPFNHTIMIH